MNKITFKDGSYIEKNASGYMYVGYSANEIGHLMRRFNMSLEEVAANESIKRIIK